LCRTIVSVNSIVVEINANTLIEYRGCSYSKQAFGGKGVSSHVGASQIWLSATLKRRQDCKPLWINLELAPSRQAVSAQSHVKMLEKMKKEGKLDPPPVAVVSMGRKPELVLTPPPKQPNAGEELDGSLLGRLFDSSLMMRPK
jgi:hypothetical protein